MVKRVVCEVHGLSYDPEQESCPACRTTTAGLKQPAAAPASRRDGERREGKSNDSLRQAATTRRAQLENGSASTRRPSQLDTQRQIETQRPRFGVAKTRSLPPSTRLHGLLAIGSLALVAVVGYRQCWSGSTGSAARAASPVANAGARATPPPDATQSTPRAAHDPAGPPVPDARAEAVRPAIRYWGRPGELPDICRVPWLDMYERKRPAPADPERGTHGRTALLVAAESGSLEELQLLLGSSALGQGPGVDERDELNHTALMLAAQAGRSAHVQALLRAGADARTRGLYDAEGGSLSALDAALLASHAETAQRIADAVLQYFLTLEGPELAALDEAGETPLHWLARYADASSVRLLLERGAELEARNCPARPGDDRGPHDQDPHSASALLLGVWADNPAVVRQLLDYKANARAVDERGRGVFHLLRHESSLALTPDLLRAGADPLLLDRDGKSALDVLAERGLRAQLLRALAAAGHPLPSQPATLADLFGILRRLGEERRDADPEPAPVVALLEQDASLLAGTDAQGRTLLFEAAAQGLGQIAEMLVNRGARLDARDRAGRSPLHEAHDADMVRRLLRLGARVDALDAARRTPLLLQAATAGSLDRVQALVEAGANPRLLDKGRHNALALARGSGSPDVVAYLQTQL